jgi:lysophospholipase
MADGAGFAMTAAPLLTDLAEGPGDGAAFWIRAGDGVRLRVAVWGRDAPRGTVLVLPGRTEAIEKYGRASSGLHARGFATAVIDWRGQGLSDRLHPNPALGHVGRFADYQKDVAALAGLVQELGLPQPLFMLAHSMGGAIGLRALMAGLDVRAAAFSSPMWGISMAPHMRPVAWTLSTAARTLGLGHVMAPGQSSESYLVTGRFDGNTLTSDPEMWDYMCRQVRAEPRLGLGGPSLTWLNEALHENRRSRAEPSPAVPALAFAAGADQIVPPDAIRARMAGWPAGRLVEMPGARHEVLMEAPALRQMVLDTVAAHFTAQT